MRIIELELLQGYAAGERDFRRATLKRLCVSPKNKIQ